MPKKSFRKPKNIDKRQREYLTAKEIADITKAARETGRHGYRDSVMILFAYRHGLRVSELVNLCWHQVDLKTGLFQVNRRKSGLNSIHPLLGSELRALRKILRAYPDTQYVFTSERKAPMTPSNFRKMLMRAGEIAELGFPIHPYMLRHSTGFKLASEKQDIRAIQHYLGHKNINHTTKYAACPADKFNNFWSD